MCNNQKYQPLDLSQLIKALYILRIIREYRLFYNNQAYWLVPLPELTEIIIPWPKAQLHINEPMFTASWFALGHR